MEAGELSFLCAGCHCGIPWWAASGRKEQALTRAPGTLSLSLSPMAGGGWTSTPLLGTAARPSLSGTWPLESRGLVFAGGGEFPGHPSQSPQTVPGMGIPPRCVGRAGVLDNLMFSTLTPFSVFEVGVGAAAKSGCWVGPLSPSPLPSLLPALQLVSGSGTLVCRAPLHRGQSTA